MQNEIKVLDDISHIRARPGMYLGSLYNPYHLLQEVLDNSLDELANGFATIIVININDQGFISVTDNGRGIPVHDVILPSGEITDSVIAACCKLFSGAKFDTSNYKTSIGLHGVGLVAINAISDNMTVFVKDKMDSKYKFIYKFINSKFISKERFLINEPWSTKVEFNITKSFVETLEIPIDILKKRLLLVASHFPKTFIYLNNERIEPLLMDILVKDILDIYDDIPIFTLTENKGDETVQIFFTYDKDGKQSATIYGDVNLNQCEGTYLSTFTTLFVNSVNTFISNEKITRSDILGQFKCYISLTIQEPKFDSQTKGRMIKNVSSLISLLKPKINNLISTNKFFKDHFTFLLESKLIQTAAKVLKTKKTRVSSDNPLKDCAKVPGKILYLLEGESAEGTLKQIRDIQIEAIFPLTGKILNAIDKSIDKAIESKKIKYLLEAIGVDLTKKNQQEFRYEKIKLLCDGDSVSAKTEIVYNSVNGTTKTRYIKDLDINDIDTIASLNKTTQKIEHKKVLRIIKHDYNKGYINRITSEHYYLLDCTDDHIVYVFNINTKQIEEISPINININIHYLIKTNHSTNFEIIKIKKIEQIEYKYNYVYDLEVEDNNNFACTRAGFILHNSDGQHIVVLAAVALWKYAPSLIKNKQVSMILPPLYGATKKKEFIPIYNYKDVDVYTQKGYTITRFKGLGEMNSEQLYEVVYNKPIEYIIEYPSNAKEGELVVLCLTDTTIKRRVCADARIGIATLLKNLSI